MSWEIYYTQEDGSIINESYNPNIRKRTRTIVGSRPPNIGRNIGNPYEYGEEQDPALIDTIIANKEKSTQGLIAATTNAINSSIEKSDQQIVKEAMEQWYGSQDDEVKAMLDQDEVYQGMQYSTSSQIEPTSDAEGVEGQADVGEEDSSWWEKFWGIATGEFDLAKFGKEGYDKRQYEDALVRLKNKYGINSIDEAQSSLISNDSPNNVTNVENFLLDYSNVMKLYKGQKPEINSNEVSHEEWVSYNLKDLRNKASYLQMEAFNMQGGQDAQGMGEVNYLPYETPFQLASPDRIYSAMIEREFGANPLQQIFAEDKQDDVETQFLLQGTDKYETTGNPFAEFLETYKPLRGDDLRNTVSDVIYALRNPSKIDYDVEAGTTGTEKQNLERRWGERFGTGQGAQSNQQKLARSVVLDQTPFALRRETASILDRLYNRWLTNPNTNTDESWLEFVDRNDYFGMIDKKEEVAPTSRGEGEYL